MVCPHFGKTSFLPVSFSVHRKLHAEFTDLLETFVSGQVV